MRDIFTESLIKANPSKNELFFRNFLIVILCCFIVLALFGSFYLILLAIVAALLLYYTIVRTTAEYEYVHTNDIFDVDRVLFNSRRKNMVSIRISDILCVVPANSSRANSYDSKSVKDFSANASDINRYAMVYRENGNTRKIILNLEHKMLDSLRLWMTEKVEYDR